MALDVQDDGVNLNPAVPNVRVGTATSETLATDLRDLLDQARRIAAEAERRLAEQSRRIAELEALSLTDELTGLFNRRGFDQMFERVARAAARDGHGGVLGYADLDGFKAINDRMGHPAGDAALRAVADILRVNVRPDDVIARMGGDEFAILLVRTNPADGLRRLATIEDVIAATPTRFGLHAVPVRASIGATTYGAGVDPAAALADADRAMYRRKQTRRGAHEAPRRAQRLRLSIVPRSRD